MNQLNIDLNKTTEIKCSKCNNTSFSQSYILRKVSKILSGTSEDGIIPITVFSCTLCGNVNEEFLPVQLKNTNNLSIVK